jgi:5-methylcytosine-specific restriction endonuclease McrA
MTKTNKITDSEDEKPIKKDKKKNNKITDKITDSEDEKPIKKDKKDKTDKKDKKDKTDKTDKTDKKLSRIELFKELGNYNKDTNCTDIVNIDKFEGKYSDLKFRNGGDWCRRSSAKPYKLMTMKGNGKFYYTWDKSNEEKEIIEKIFDEYCEKIDFKKDDGPKIKFIKICGLLDDDEKRPIRHDIKKYYKNINCVHCGSKSELVCDHKNDLYNDPKVLDTKTQTLDDFQSLCMHCNLQKRQIMKDTLKENKRYGATNIPMLKPFNIDFTIGDEKFDKNDFNAMKGTYWYDPIDFMKRIKILIRK